MSASFRSALMVVAGCSAAFLIMPAATARADVFNMPAGQTNLQFVTVGDAGNGADTTGYGSVPYVYQMGTYDVTIGQYIQFLNAVANTDTYGLYNSGMLAVAGRFPFGIVQNGGPGSYSYAVAGNYSQAANCPVFSRHLGRCRAVLQLAAKRAAHGHRGAGHHGNRSLHAQRRHHFSHGDAQRRFDLRYPLGE